MPVKTSRNESFMRDGEAGSGTKRRLHLFRLLFKSICMTGVPVLLALDDLHVADQFVLDIVSGLTETDDNEIYMPVHRQGLFVLGTYRIDETNEGDFLTDSIRALELNRMSSFTNLAIKELTPMDVHNLVSNKLCLPARYTKSLATLIHSKTANGNAFFVNEWLKTIIHHKILRYSLKSRRWIWENESILMKNTSDEMAKLLMIKFSHLPDPLMKSVKIISCIGIQVEQSTVQILNKDGKVLPFDINTQLEEAVKSGIMEKFGPDYRFSHAIIQETIYEAIGSFKIRSYLHKTIGKALLRSAGGNSAIHLLAVDQYNLFCKEETNMSAMNIQERSLLATINATAARFALAKNISNLEQARNYIDCGVRLLGTNCWEGQYALSLDLYQMSAMNHYGSGDMASLSTDLNEILSHAKTFEDSLAASALLSRLLASSNKYKDAFENCLSILATLGETFPEEITPDHLKKCLREISSLPSTLEQANRLPNMTCTKTLNKMRFLDMLCTFTFYVKPTLLPLITCRMVSLTKKFGLCENSLVGFVLSGYTLFIFTEHVYLGYRIGKLTLPLIDASPKRNFLRSRLCAALDSSMRLVVEPLQSVIIDHKHLYTTSMLLGDVDNAVMIRMNFCIGNLLCSGMKFPKLRKHFIMLIQESAKYQQTSFTYSSMAFYQVYSYLSGQSKRCEIEFENSCGVELKSHTDLEIIAMETNNIQLLYHTFIGKITKLFWMRNYLEVMTLCERTKRSQLKRILDVFRVFYEGLSALALARSTHGEASKIAEWIAVGEANIEYMTKLESHSKWNWSNKLQLLQAEHHYMRKDIVSAEILYAASIKSAHDHKFHHEEALAYELGGLFCLENKMTAMGLDRLRSAVERYNGWGALEKSKRLQLLIDTTMFREQPSL